MPATMPACIHVLIMTENSERCQNLTEMLTTSGLQVEVSTTSASTLALASNRSPAVIILDYQPGTPEVLARVKEAATALPPTAVIIAAETATIATARAALSIGATGVIELRGDRGDILQVVSRAVIAILTARQTPQTSVSAPVALSAPGDEALNQTLIAAGIGAWTYDLAARALGGSPPALACYQVGGDTQSLAEERLRAMLHPDDIKKVHERLFAAMASGREVAVEYRVVWTDGQIRHLIMDGRPAGARNYHGIIRDVTAQQEAQHELRKLAKAVTYSANSVVITNTEGLIEYVNPKFTELTGYTLEELKDKTPRILKSGRQNGEYYKDLWQTIKAGKVWRGPVENKKKNGEAYWEYSVISPVFDDDGKITHFIAIKEDVTARRHAEQEREAVRAQMHHKSRLAAIGTLAAGVAHEINNPLTILDGYVRRIERGIQGHSDFKDKFTEEFLKIRDSVRRIVEIVDGLRLYARFDAEQLDDIETHDAVRKATGMVHAIYKKSAVVIKEHLAADNDHIKASVGKIQQIVLNLLSNAKDAMEAKGGGTIALETRNYAGQLILTVADEGSGIEAKDIERIFDPFYTTKAPGQGTGLGLGIVRSLVTLMNGTIAVESSVGVGTKFTVAFPLLGIDKTQDAEPLNAAI